MHDIVMKKPQHPNEIYIKVFCERKCRSGSLTLNRAEYIGKPVHCPACGNPIEVPELQGGEGDE